MSYTTVYEMPAVGSLIEIAKFPNAWGSAMRVWTALMHRYMIPATCEGMERTLSLGKILCDEDEQAKLWKLHEDPRLTTAEKVVHLWTYDKALVESDRLTEMADHFEEFERLHPGNKGSHLPAFAALYRSHQPDTYALGLCVVQTSVCCDVWRRPGDEDGEDRMYDASRDNDHFGVFASLSSN